MRSLRLWFLADRLSARGGADWHLLGVLGALADHGHAVHLAVGRIDTAPPSGVTVTRLQGLDAPGPAAVTLQQQLAATRPELIHLHNVVNPTALEQIGQWGLPTVTTIQDHRFFCPGRGKWDADGTPCVRPMSRRACASCFDDPGYFERLFALTERRLAAIRHCSVIVLSHYMKRELAAVGLNPQRVLVVPPFPFGLDRGANPDGPPCVLFVGRLVRAKGADDLIDLWQRSGLDLPLVIAGTGSSRNALEQTAARDCHLLGWVPHERLSALYRRAAVLVMPCRWQEPFGIVGLESMTLGTPVAAWRSGGIEEWHPGDGLVEWGNVAELSRAMGRLAGRQVAPPVGFEQEALTRRLVDFYRQVIQQA